MSSTESSGTLTDQEFSVLTESGSQAGLELFRLFDWYDLSTVSASVRSGSRLALTDRIANHSRKCFQALRGVGGFSRAVLGAPVAGYVEFVKLGLAQGLLIDYI